MGRLILHKDGAYNIHLTIVDAPLFNDALTLDELTEYIREEYGRSGIRELQARLQRAHATGSSAIGGDLESEIMCNRAGEGESELSFDEYIDRFLTLRYEGDNG